MIVLPGRRYAVESAADLPSLLEALWLIRRRLSTIVTATTRGDWHTVQQTSRQTSTRLLELLDARMHITGCEHIDPGEEYVVVALHESFVDVIALLQLPLDLAWVARDELMGTPGLYAALDSNLAVTISPERPRTALRRLVVSAPVAFAEGRSLAMFPQGTLLGIETAFAKGAFRIADKFGRPVLPVVITGTHGIYDYPFSPLVRFGQEFRISVLEPVRAGSAVASAGDLERRMRSDALTNQPPPRRYRPDEDGFWEGYAFEIAEDFPVLREQLATHRRISEPTQGVSR